MNMHKNCGGPRRSAAHPTRQFTGNQGLDLFQCRIRPRPNIDSDHCRFVARASFAYHPRPFSSIE